MKKIILAILPLLITALICNRPPAAQPEADPTATIAVKPAVEPQPIRLQGTDNAVVDFEKWPGPAMVKIDGNAENRHFAVTAHGGKTPDLLVNTTASYRGWRLIDAKGEQTSRFEIVAVGEWQIEICPLSYADTIPVPGQIAGQGDNVLVLNGQPDTATIHGNAESRHFAVTAYGGRLPDLLVNTTETYQGTVIVDNAVRVLEIVAVGEWQIEVK